MIRGGDSETSLRRSFSIPNDFGQCTTRRISILQRSFSVQVTPSNRKIIMRMIQNEKALLKLFCENFASHSVMVLAVGTDLSHFSSEFTSHFQQPLLQVAKLQFALAVLSKIQLNNVIDVTQLDQLTTHNGLQDLLNRAINQLLEIIFRLNNENIHTDMSKATEHLHLADGVELIHPQQIFDAVTAVEEYLKQCINERTSQDIII